MSYLGNLFSQGSSSSSGTSAGANTAPATAQQLYGGSPTGTNATGQQIFGGGPTEVNATPQQIYGGGGELMDMTAQQMFGGSNPPTPVGPAASSELQHADASTPVPLVGPAASSEHQHADTLPVSNARYVSPFDKPFADLINSVVRKNPLNHYWQPTYHFRLFLCGDGDVVEKEGEGKITTLTKKLNDGTIPQVIIAETGVTGYNIKDVEIKTVAAQTATVRDQTVTTIVMTVVEPLGVTFLDAMRAAGSALDIFDYTKTNFYLMLNFVGYNPDGSFANPIKLDDSTNPSTDAGANTFRNGGQWLWVLALGNIQTTINEGGGVYKLEFVIQESNSLINELEKFTTSSVINVEGTTVKELLNAYATALTKASADKYGATPDGKSIYTFKIDASHPIPFGPYQGSKPEEYAVKNSEHELSSDMHFAIKGDGSPNSPHRAAIPAGLSVNEVITSIIKATEKGQEVILDLPVPSDLNSQKQKRRVSTLFSVEPRLVVDKVEDKITGKYCKTITFHVVPCYKPTTLLTMQDVTNANSPSVQRQMIEEMMESGFLFKRYDYIFTGLNTEVLDTKLDFNFAWQAITAKAWGARFNFLTERTQQRWNPHPAPDPVNNPAVKMRTEPTTSPPSQTTPAAPPIVVAQNTQQNPPSMVDATPALTQGSVATPPQPTTTAQASTAQQTAASIGLRALETVSKFNGKVYIEDILSRYYQKKPLPISFVEHYLDANTYAGITLPPQYHQGRSLVGALVNQVYDTSIAGFQTIQLTIRGDPYWLGQSNAERQILLDTKITYDKGNLPDWSSGSPLLFFYWRYPLQVGDDFKPILTESGFNGIYECNEVTHTFADGAFKQVLTCTRAPLIDLDLAYASDDKPVSIDESSAPIAQNTRLPRPVNL